MHNRRNQVATKPKPPRAKASPRKQVAAFPAEVAIPPRRGASLKVIDLPLPIPAAPVRVAAQPLFAMPTPRADERLRTPAKPRKRKAPTKRRKTAGKVRKAKTPDPAVGLAAFALPRQEEPLVSAAPAQSRALAVIRPAGLLGQIGQWLSERSEAVWDRLGGLRTAPASSAELQRLRAENAKLRAQLEAFIALRQNIAPSAQDRAPLPVP